MQDFAELLPTVISKLPDPIRYRAENALDGFKRAKLLLGTDREIASFRAITATEEAASALIRSLQLRNYPGADQVSLRSHEHKAAVIFFIEAVRSEIAQDRLIRMRVTLAADPPELTIAMPISQFASLPKDLENLHIELAEPLGIVLTKSGVDGRNLFDAAVQKVASSHKVDRLLKTVANYRNKILYAHDSGLPVSRATLDGIELRERQGMLCIMLAVAVLQVQSHQSFAIQCLAGYLKVIRRVTAV